MSRLKNSWGFLLVLAVLLILYSQLPLGSALEFGGDEGCELMKAFMGYQGFHLYQDIWNDQPPVLTLLLNAAFHWGGPSLIAGRLVAATFGLILCGTFFLLVRERLGQGIGLLAVFLLLASPGIISLSVSVMLEVPAFAIALVSVWLLFQWTKNNRRTWLLASGITLGIALQIKLTAILVAPAMLVEIALTRPPGELKSRWMTVAANWLGWGLAATLTALTIIGIFARGSLKTAMKSHFGALPGLGLQGPDSYPFQISLLTNHWECVAAALAGIIWVVWRRRWRETLFPMILLLTAAIIHSFHRPWWSYYYLHLAVPLAWLAALAVGRALQEARENLGNRRSGSSRLGQGIALCALGAFVLARSESRLEAGVRILRESPRVEGDPILAKMRQYASRTHWVYADQEMYPFLAQLKTPPELTVVVLKRFWSGQFTQAQMVEVCQRRGAEQILLKPEQAQREWTALLADYDPVYKGTNYVLYVAKRIEN